jgi:hypothetical protein
MVVGPVPILTGVVAMSPNSALSVDWVRVAGGLAAVVAVVTGVVSAIVGIWRWLRRRRSAPSAEIGPVQFSGRSREVFVERVWAQRIANGLERSLQHATEMHLGLQNAPDLVQLSYAQSTAAPGQLLRVEDAYGQAGGQLVILGGPGSGKTTEALKLMRALLREARLDEAAPVPEIFPLSSWAKEHKPILEWLADQLRARHGRPLSEARSLVWHHQVVAVLDGLDEVAPEHREECVQAINSFWENHRGGPLVLCCRQAEYEILPERAKLGGAVTICPPGQSEIDRYLAAAGARWEWVRGRLRDASEQGLRELLSTPLMLNVAVLAYQSDDPMELCGMKHTGAERDRLWSRYIWATTSRSYVPTAAPASEIEPAYSEAQIRRWLGWIAKEMRARNESELWLHEWSGPPGLRITVKLISVLVAGVALGLGARYFTELTFGTGWPTLAFGVIGAVAFGLKVGPTPTYRKRFAHQDLPVGIAKGLALGVVLSLSVGLALLLFLGLSWGPHIHGGFSVSLAIAIVVSLVNVLIMGPALTLLAGLSFALLGVGRERDRLPSGSPEAAIRTSARLGIVFGLVLTLTVGLTYFLAFSSVAHIAGSLSVRGVQVQLGGTSRGLPSALVFGLSFGFVGGLFFGIDCTVFHAAFRLWLRTHDLGPWNWARFLRWASEHLLLRSGGPAYQWVHLELRDYLSGEDAQAPLRPPK